VSVDTTCHGEGQAAGHYAAASPHNPHTTAEARLTAGGPHHSVYSAATTGEILSDLAEMLDVESLFVDADTQMGRLRRTAALEPGALPAGARLAGTGPTHRNPAHPRHPQKEITC
jgi:hypothetical protein